MVTLLVLRKELKECQEELKRWQIEAEYQRRWKRYWWKRYNMSIRNNPVKEIREPEYAKVKKHFEETGSLFDPDEEIK